MQFGLVSIMMPAYNAEKYIGKAIESVLAQSYPYWELIVVNDGSTDGTADIVNLYTNDARIKLIHQVNGGEAAARNTALEHSLGEYITFLDADDLYLPTTLADRSRFLYEHPEYGVVVTDGSFCDDSGQILGRVSDIRPGRYTGNILEPLLLSPAVVSVPVGVMIRRSIIERHKFRFDTNVGYGTDWDFWIRVARHIQFGYLDKLTYMYRVHDMNMTRNTGQQKTRKDRIYGRMKILNSDWFEELSVPTRRRFFYNLLIDLLAGQPAEQKAILDSEQFRRLPGSDQAKIWRQVGIDYLLAANSIDQKFALDCLHKAASLYPKDRKTQVLLQILKFGNLPTWGVLYLWRALYKVYTNLPTLGRRKAKPVPVQLRPIGD